MALQYSTTLRNNQLDAIETTIGGVALRRTDTYGWANQFTASRAGSGSLAYDTPVSHRAVVFGELVAWILVLWA